MINYDVINILDILVCRRGCGKCRPLQIFMFENPEIENFVRKNAIDFAKKKI